MKYVYIIMLTLISLTVNASQCYDLDSGQVKVLNKAYQMGKAHDLSYTMMAIAMEESTAGKFRMSFETRDYGVMQNNLKTAASRMGVKGYYPKLKLAERLIVDDQLSMELALEELLYWKRHTPNWRGMVSAYNNGWAWDKGSVYLNKIVNHVKTFMKCWEPKTMLELNKTQRIIDFHGAVIVLPDGVEYISMDADGGVWGYNDEPVMGDGYFYPQDPHTDEVIKLVDVSNPEAINWEDSLVEVEL